LNIEWHISNQTVLDLAREALRKSYCTTVINVLDDEDYAHSDFAFPSP
jgi:hypothetical protein